MDRIKKFVKTSGIYFLGSILTKIISFILLPLYSNRLSAGEFGYYDYTITIVTIVVGVVCIEVWTGAIRFLLLKEERQHTEQVVCNSLILILGSAVCLGVIYIVLKNQVTIPYLNYIAIYAAFYMLQSLYCAFIRGYQRNLDYVISGLISSALNLLINVYFIGIRQGGIEYLYIAFSVGAAFQILYIELRVHSLRTIRKKYINKELLKNLFVFCLPLFINSISYWVLTSYSKIIITNELGASANGVYSMGLRFSSVITLVTSVLSLAWQELVFSEKKDAKDLYSQGIRMYCCLLVYGLIGALPILKIIYPWIINKEYIGALTILPICLISTLCNAYADFIGKIVIAEGRTKFIFISSVLGAVSCVAVAQSTVAYLGIVGIAAAVLVGFLISIIVRLVWIKVYFRDEVKVKGIIMPILQLNISFIGYYLLGNVEYVIISLLLGGWIVLQYRESISKIWLIVKNRR